jgi:hypothetical protein
LPAANNTNSPHLLSLYDDEVEHQGHVEGVAVGELNEQLQQNACREVGVKKEKKGEPSLNVSALTLQLARCRPKQVPMKEHGK